MTKFDELKALIQQAEWFLGESGSLDHVEEWQLANATTFSVLGRCLVNLNERISALEQSNTTPSQLIQLP